MIEEREFERTCWCISYKDVRLLVYAPEAFNLVLGDTDFSFRGCGNTFGNLKPEHEFEHC